MAYIPPNSTIQLFKNLPLNPDYENTYYFHSRQDDVGETGQNTFFGDRATATFTAASYVRKERGVIKLQAQYENVYDCNYMRYRNTSFEYKWFYAFVLKVEYINNETVEITFQPDVMQTWLPYVDYDFEQCLIEREHTPHDEYFANLIPEKLDYGDTYVLNGAEDEFDFYTNEYAQENQSMKIVLIAGRDINGNYPDPEHNHFYNNVYCPLFVYVGTPDEMALILQYYASTTNAPTYEDIVAFYMVPAQFPSFLPSAASSQPFPVVPEDTFTVLANLDSIDGYTPVNKKLFNYPYTLLSVSNNNGSVNEYKWENWAVGNTWSNKADLITNVLGKVAVKASVLPPASAICYPTHYNKIEKNMDEGIIIDNFPQCPWVGDTFKAWLAQHKASLAMTVASSLLTAGGALGVAQLMPVPMLRQALMAQQGFNVGADAAQIMGQVFEAAARPSSIGGQVNTDYLNAIMKRYKFTYRPLSIKSEFAKKIDMYFQMYGYATHEIRKPYMHHREKWWYIKTIGSDINGTLPADDIAEICKIYDNGIRFWWDKAHIGVYNTLNIEHTPDFPI